MGGSGGRVLTETLYDSRGLEWKVYDDYYATGDPEPVLVAGDDTKAPAAVRITHDGVGRPTETVALKYGTETRRATTVYDGNHTTVIPPKGGTARTTVTDALDRPVEEIEYTNESRTASQSTKYAYDARGLLERITDPAGTVRTFAYDARGREVRAEDPDQGTTTMTYDVLDRRASTTDARGVSLTTVYDALGRVVSVKEGSTLRSEWVYDTIAKGELSEARRYVDGQAYTQKVTGYTHDYQPTGMQAVVPSAQGDLAGTYTWGFGYNDKTGLLTQITQPALGDLPAERVVTRHDADDQAQGLTAGGRIRSTPTPTTRSGGCCARSTTTSPAVCTAAGPTTSTPVSCCAPPPTGRWQPSGSTTRTTPTTRRATSSASRRRPARARNCGPTPSASRPTRCSA
ncbi:RHS repeat domain-containing protein [Streptomyces sp. D2-8]|uniref:RHS repeat domain-containing protein n=1 Tax=Streptomyces sp. D2-8 TaxID=2707767 RepID=UPI0020BF425F|nr:RHS repeat protein [Streptomyces sp. D2-8]